jgi:hypothetical protein
LDYKVITFISLSSHPSGVRLPLDDLDFNKTLLHFFNASIVAQVADFYPLPVYRNNDNRAAFLLRDFFFTCAARYATPYARPINTPSRSPYLAQTIHIDLLGFVFYFFVHF